MILSTRSTCTDIASEPLLPITGTPCGSVQMIHNSGSRSCPIIAKGPCVPVRGFANHTPIADLSLDMVAPRRSIYCPNCFEKEGLAEILALPQASDPTTPLGKLIYRCELVGLAERCDHVRNGLNRGHQFAKRDTPVVMRKAAKLRKQIAALDPAEQLLHQAAIAKLNSAADQLEALVNPSATNYALDRLTRRLTAPPREWMVLDQTPTLLAVAGTNTWRINTVLLAPELIAALRVSGPNSDGLVLYGPRFAIDYLQRAWGIHNTYILATTETDPQVAKMAGGIWSIKDGIPDLFTAITLARQLVAKD